MSTPTSPPPLGVATLPPVPSNVAQGTAPILLGTLLNWCMYGILLVQVYLYSYYFPDDRRALKFLVYFVFIIETVQTALTGVDIYYWFAKGFGNVLHLNNVYISFADTPITAGFITFIIQSFFCYRIWVLENSLWWLATAIEAVSATQAVGGIVGGIKGHINGEFSEAHRAIKFVYVWLIGDAVADILIAASLTYLLLRSRTRGHQFSSNSMLVKLVHLTIETNAASATVAIVSLAVFVGCPNNNYFILPTAVLGKIYSNTLLVTLNNRITFRHGMHVRNPSSYNDTTLADSSGTAERFAPSHPGIIVQRSIEQYMTLPKPEIAAQLDYGDTRPRQIVGAGSIDASTLPAHPVQLRYLDGIGPPGLPEFPLPTPSSTFKQPLYA
ncbi:hypothetical protein BC834DRAFT_62169 [Gloeopeniophorella convolvens]|nr:hypothetical protein BC834DRAFT_62169 [Gloeopeniophorella convolvens]